MKYTMKKMLTRTLAVLAAALTLVPAVQPVHADGNIGYTISIHTADISGAGTDGSVYVQFVGENGESGWTALDSSNDDFERNKLDTYTVKLPDVGKVIAVDFELECKGMTSILGDWTADYFEFDGQKYKIRGTDDMGNDVDGRKFSSDNSRKDNFYEVTLIERNKVSYIANKKTYTAEVTCGEVTHSLGAYIRYRGDEGKTKWELCTEKIVENSTETITAELDDVGTVRQVELYLSGDAFSEWYIDKIKYNGNEYNVSSSLDRYSIVTVDLSTGQASTCKAKDYVESKSYLGSSGSTFSNMPIWAIAACGAGIIVVIALLIFIVKKKKKTVQE